MSRLPLHSQRQFGEAPVVVALAATVQGRVHAAGVATAPQSWLMDGGPYDPDYCYTHNRVSCIIASEVRALRRALGQVGPSRSITVVTATPGTIQLLTDWLGGSTDMPEWYRQHVGARGRRSALERSRNQLMAHQNKVRLQLVAPPHPLMPLVALAANLGRIADGLLRSRYVPAEASRRAQALFGPTTAAA